MWHWNYQLFSVYDPCQGMDLGYEQFPNQHVIGAEPRDDLHTLAECQADCNTKKDCTAVDWE